MFSDSHQETTGISSLFSCTNPPLPYSDTLPSSSTEDDNLKDPNIKMASQYHQQVQYPQSTLQNKYSEIILEENDSGDDSPVGCHWMVENNEQVVLPEEVFQERIEQQFSNSQDYLQLSTQMERHKQDREFLNQVLQEQKNIFEQTLLKIAEPVFETQASSLQTYQSVTAQMETVREQISSIQQKSQQQSKDLQQRNQEIEGQLQFIANQDVGLRQYCAELNETLSETKQQMSQKIQQTKQLTDSIKDVQDKMELNIITQVNFIREKITNAERKQAEASEEIQVYLQKANDQMNEAFKKPLTILEANLDSFKHNLATKINTSDVKTLFASMNDGFYDEIEKTLRQIQEDIKTIQSAKDNNSQIVNIQELSKELQGYYLKLKTEMAKTVESQQQANRIIDSFQSNFSLVQHQRSRIDALEAVVTSLLLQKSETEEVLQQELSKGEQLSRKAQFLNQSLIKMSEQFQQLKKSSQNNTALKNSNSQILLLRHENKELRQTLDLKEKALQDQAIILAAFKEQIQNQKDQLNNLVQELQEIKSERKQASTFKQQIDKSNIPFFFTENTNKQANIQHKKTETTNVSMLSSIVSAKSAGDDSLSESFQKMDDFVGSSFKKNNHNQDNFSSSITPSQSQQLQPFLKLTSQAESKLNYIKQLSLQAKESSQMDQLNSTKNVLSKEIKTEQSPSNGDHQQQSITMLQNNPKTQIQQLQQRIASYLPQHSKQHQHSKSSSVLLQQQQTLPYSQTSLKDIKNIPNEITNNQTVKPKHEELIIQQTNEIKIGQQTKQLAQSPHHTSDSQSSLIKEPSVSTVNSQSLISASMDIEKLIKRRLLYNNALKNKSETKLTCKLDKNNQLKDEQGKYIYSNEGHPVRFTTEQLNYLLQDAQILLIEEQATCSK